MKSIFICILPSLALSACNHSDQPATPSTDAELQQKLAGIWRADDQIPRGIHVQSETIVEPDGSYILLLTNTLSNGMRRVTLAGTFAVKNGMLIDTMTNDFTNPKYVPWRAGANRILRLDEHELILRVTDTNGADTTETFKKDDK